MFAGSWMLTTLVLATCQPAGRPFISEVFYDAAGDDEGLEYVELFNAGAAAHDITGVRLEAGDGAGPGRWTLRWTAPSGATIGAGGRFVIGGAHVVPMPDAVVELSLQNGPDAMRLVWPDGASEVVGYGALTHAEYACGAPAPDVASGLSLARIPDTSDQGGNALDFRAANPTPGRVNLPRRSVAWIRDELAVEPDQPPPGLAATLRGRVWNTGAESWAAGDLEVAVSERRASGITALTRSIVPHAAAPGESLDVAVVLPPLAAGDLVVLAEAWLAGADSVPGLDTLRTRVGAGPLEITEIQFHPSAAEGEWVELRNRSGSPLQLAGHIMLDRGGTRGRPDELATCATDSLVVFAQDRAALLAAYPELDVSRVWTLRPWPSLNNTDDASGIADVVRWRDADDLPCDRVDYSAATAPAGVPIERDPAGVWRAALDPRGSPLRPGREPAALSGAFELARPVVPAEQGVARMAWALPWREARVRVDAYDLSGRHGGVLLDDTRLASRGERDLATTPLSPGLWVLVMRARQAVGDSTVRASRVLRLTGAWR